MRIEWGGSAADIRELGSGPSIVLVHGYPLDGAMWSGVARVLAPGFRVLKPDLPGRGNTDAPAPDSIAGYADFVETLIAGLDPPVGLAGFSFGGYISIELMKRGPQKVRALALVDTHASADDAAGRARRDEAIAGVRAEGVRPVVESMPEKLLSRESLGRPDLVERIERMISRQKPDTLVADLAAMRDRPDSVEFLPRVSVPTLVVVGEEDTLTPPANSESMAAAIPGARLVRIPGAGHLTPMEKPKAVASALADFFSSALAS